MSETENPQAFPGMEYDNTAGQRYHYGMTLRDWFAGMALQGLEPTEYSGNNDDIADRCYKMADAMLKRRGQDE